jgi:hypothetical protein
MVASRFTVHFSTSFCTTSFAQNRQTPNFNLGSIEFLPDPNHLDVFSGGLCTTIGRVSLPSAFLVEDALAPEP